VSGRSAKKLRRELKRQVADRSRQVHLRVRSLAGGVVGIDFGALTSGFRLPAAEARRFAEAIIKHASEGATDAAP
jgi:hypothetical protein